MITEEYLGRSRVFRRLKSGPHRQLVELYSGRLVRDGLGRQGTWRCLSVVGGLLGWLARSRWKLTDLNEPIVERYLRHRAANQFIQPGDRTALKRLLSVLRDAGVIAPAAAARSRRTSRYSTSSLIICTANAAWHRSPSSATCRSSADSCVRLCPAGASDLGKITRKDVTRYIERHARDQSAGSGKAMCWALRTFLRYLYLRGLNPFALAACVPSIRRWKFANLPTYLSVAQVQKVLDGCDRTTALGRRDYAILLMLARLGLRAGEVVTLTLDDIDWRAGEMLLRAKGRQRVRMPMPPDVGAAIVAYLRDGRPLSSCRRLFLRTLAPRVGFASGCAITMIAKTALERAGIRGCAHQGAHIFRHSLASALLQSGATLSEIGQLLRHESHDTTRVYAKVDTDALRTLSLPWPGGGQ